MASKETIEIIKTTVPVLKLHGEKITEVFYKLLFQNHPELKDTFNMVNQKKGTQPKALANAIFQYAVHIDKLEMLGDAVETIAQKHTSLSISKEAYPIVGENLLAAIKEVLGDAATPAIINAWAEAYGDLAAIFIKREEDIYTTREKSLGGFRGMKEFIVTKKVKESSVITSFYLKRKDGSPVPTFSSGQYVTITVNIPNTLHKHTRNYSMSDASDKDYLRISVKKETGNPDGIVSNYLHSSITEGSLLSIGMPSGEFVLKETKNPIVFISGGIGVTPLLSMFKKASLEENRNILFIECVLNSETQAFKTELTKLATTSTVITVYSNPLEKDVLNENYHYKGYLTNEILDNLNVSNKSDFYFCGPTPFMANTLKLLKNIEVENSNINYEFFGPKDQLELKN